MAPKKAKLAEAESTLAATMELLNRKRAELAEIEEKVATLKAQFQEMTEKKQNLEFQVRWCWKEALHIFYLMHATLEILHNNKLGSVHHNI